MRFVCQDALFGVPAAAPLLAAEFLHAGALGGGARSLAALHFFEEQLAREKAVETLLARGLAFDLEAAGPVQEHDASGGLVHVLAAMTSRTDECLLDVDLAHAQRHHALGEVILFFGADRECAHARSMAGRRPQIHQNLLSNLCKPALVVERGLCFDFDMKTVRFYSNRWAPLLALVLLVSCTTVPETGRKQFNFMSSGQEMELGLTSFNKMKKEVPVSKDPAINALVQKVGKRIAAVATLPNAQWEFVVFESKEANAFCLPGGKVGVYSGILPITRNEAGLAVVLGHEVAHATSRHGGERMSEATAMQMGGQLLGLGLSATDPRIQAAASIAYGSGATLLRELPHSREQESEADFIGLKYMARAGYDPEEAVNFWRRFAEVEKQSGSGTPWFLRTHPVNETRIQDIKAKLPQAKQEYRPQP